MGNGELIGYFVIISGMPMPSHNFFHSLVPAGEWVGNLTNMELARSSVIGLVLGSALGLVIRRSILR